MANESQKAAGRCLSVGHSVIFKTEWLGRVFIISSIYGLGGLPSM